MLQTPVYLDNHATTRVDPRVLERMLPFFGEVFGNPASTSHVFGRRAKEFVDVARAQVALALGASPGEIVFTSGATESNNLAIRGVCERVRRKGSHVISVATEHKAVLEPLKRLEARGYEITLLPVRQQPHPDAGLVDLDQLARTIRPDTVLVSVMWANNEMGGIQPLREIGQLCSHRGVLLHTDAAQAAGKIPLDVRQVQVDLMSLSAHKIYGPKGVGALYVRRRRPPVRLESQIDGGRHEQGLRSGTLNVPGIAGLAAALVLCVEELPAEMARLRALRDRLYDGLQARIPGVALNGPALSHPELRLPGNLNCRFDGVDGEALLTTMPDLAVSAGSACNATESEPSHVLRALGLSDEQARASVRFGLGRFTTDEEIEFAIGVVADAVHRLRSLRSAL